MKHWALYLPLFVLLGIGARACVDALNMPDVFYSSSSEYCLGVKEYVANPAGYSCDNLPETYNLIWVH